VKRSLGFWPFVATIVCCVSGGPYDLEPVVQCGLGLSILLVLITPFLWAVPAALMTAELAAAMPSEGGYYVWVRRAMGPFWGFLCGWWSWVYSWVDVAIYPVLFTTYALMLARMLGHGADLDAHPWTKWSIGMALILPLTWLNIRGVKGVGQASLVFLGLILAPFVVLVLMGLPRVFGHPPDFHAHFAAGDKKGSQAFMAGLFVVMWNYLGWDTLSTVSGEVEDPRRTFPRALAIAVPLVTMVYLLPILIGTVYMPDTTLWKEGSWTEVGRLVGGHWLGVAVAACGLAAGAGLFSSSLLAGSRIPLVLAESNVLPVACARLHSRFGTPWVAILVSALFYSVFSFGSFKDLAEVDVIVYSAGLLLEFLALLILRAREPSMDRPFKIPGGWPGAILVVLLPSSILLLAIVDALKPSSEQGARTVLIFTAIALGSGPLVWLMRPLWSRRLQDA